MTMSNVSVHSQRARVREYLVNNGSITGAQAFLELGIYRLSGRIKELREEGMKIETVKTDKSQMATYIYTPEEN